MLILFDLFANNVWFALSNVMDFWLDFVIGRGRFLSFLRPWTLIRDWAFIDFDLFVTLDVFWGLDVYSEPQSKENLGAGG